MLIIKNCRAAVQKPKAANPNTYPLPKDFPATIPRPANLKIATHNPDKKPVVMQNMSNGSLDNAFKLKFLQTLLGFIDLTCAKDISLIAMIRGRTGLFVTKYLQQQF